MVRTSVDRVTSPRLLLDGYQRIFGTHLCSLVALVIGGWTIPRRWKIYAPKRAQLPREVRPGAFLTPRAVPREPLHCAHRFSRRNATQCGGTWMTFPFLSILRGRLEAPLAIAAISTMAACGGDSPGLIDSLGGGRRQRRHRRRGAVQHPARADPQRGAQGRHPGAHQPRDGPSWAAGHRVYCGLTRADG